MKRLALVALLWVVSPAWSAVTYVASGTVAHQNNAATAPGIPAGHTTNDTRLIIDSFETTAGTVAATGFTSLSTTLSTGTNSSRLTVFGKTDGGSDTGASVTVAGGATGDVHSSVEIAIRGAETAIGSLVVASATSTNDTADQSIETPARTVSVANALVLLAVRFGDDLGACTLSTQAGFTKVGEYDSTLGGDQTIAVYYQIQTTATNIAAGTITVSGCANTAKSIATILVLKSAATGIAVTSVDGDDSVGPAQTNVVVAGSGFNATQSTGFVQFRDAGITSNWSIDSWSDASIQGDPAQGNVRFGSRVTRVQNSGGSFADRVTLITPAAAEWYVDIAGLITLNFNTSGSVSGRIRGQPNRYYDFPTDLANGDQLDCKRTSGSGNLTLNANGTFIAASTIKQLQCRFWDASSSTWGSFQTWDLTGASPTFTGPNP